MIAALWFAPLLSDALAKPPKEPKLDCEWVGEGKDPFTGADARRSQRRYLLLGIRYAFGVPVNGAAPFDVSLRAGGVIDAPMEQPIRLLLTDGSVIDVPIPSTKGTPYATSGAVLTGFAITTTVSTDVLQRIASSGGVTHARFVFPTGEWTMTFKDEDMWDLPHAARCALDAPAL